ncbi:MAG TPA: helix-turn-helix domain-containing protein [Solirubrobacterales bacterium]|nr:helix-turn-helix domain-containing protein [Solirubrobacterales bacterium]
MNVRLDFPEDLVEAIADRVAQRIGNSPVSPLLTVEEAAEYLRCKPKRIYDLTSQRRLAFVKDGSRTLIRRDALDQYLADNQENAA